MKRTLICLLICAVLLCGCGSFPTTVKECTAMDTAMRLTVYAENADAILDRAVAEIRRLEGLWDVTDPDSDVGRINRNSGQWVSISQETVVLIQIALNCADRSGGAYDPTVYPLVKAWGFTTDAYRIPTKAEIDSLLPNVNYRRVELYEDKARIPKGWALDLGGVAKGYTADLIAEFLRSNGISGGILDLGGNIYTLGEKPDGSAFSVAIQDPRNTTEFAETLSLPGNLGVVTSGDYQRYFEKDGVRYHHLIDPATGRPAESELASVTVLGTDCGIADGMATAFYIMGQKKTEDYIRQHTELAAVLIKKDGTIITCGQIPRD